MNFGSDDMKIPAHGFWKIGVTEHGPKKTARQFFGSVAIQAAAKASYRHF